MSLASIFAVRPTARAMFGRGNNLVFMTANGLGAIAATLRKIGPSARSELPRERRGTACEGPDLVEVCAF